MKNLYAGIYLPIGVLIVILIAVGFLVKNNLKKSLPSNQVADQILKDALNLYISKKAQGIDFSNGPCLGTVAPDWVVDIAHNPRQEIDNISENQCTDFREGRAHHFIELAPDGNLIKIY